MTDVMQRLSAALADRYRIERELGAGGMATVYLAEDLKHDRKVALKVLKPELAAVLGAERFVVEIKTTASMSHPHILPLFDSGSADGFLFYVMPYIEGETIRDRLNRETQLGVDEAVRVACEIADALDYAHRHGVIHRDIKPENILLHDGRAMVMDFGIALAVSAAAGGRMTETGLSLGTPHYMSPEQATADKAITGRSDVYSLASVLFEMLAGEPPHTGSSAQQIIMKIITERAQPVTELRKAVPPNVAAALARALEKLPADRLDSARAFADALKNPAFSTGLATAVEASGASALRVFGQAVAWRTVATVATALAVIFAAIATGMFANARNGVSGAVVTRAEIDILSQTDTLVTVRGLDIAPDGSAFVYAAVQRPDTTTRLYLRRADDRTARAIPLTEGATYPAFSPDGQWIAFVFGRAEIRRIPATGGAVETVARNASPMAFISELSWGSDGYLYYDSDGATGLNRVPANGGTPRAFLGGDPEDPDPLPDGRHVLYTECCADTSDVRVVDVETGKSRSLGVRGRTARYLPAGYLVLVNSDAIKAVKFDARDISVTGEPFAVLDSVTSNGSVGSFALASNGTAVYTVRPQVFGSRFVPTLVDLAGREQRLPLPPANYSTFRFSPDGRRLVYTQFTGVSDTLFIHDLLLGTTTTRAVAGSVVAPIWSPKGTEILFAVFNRSVGTSHLIAVRADGSERPDTLLNERFAPSEGRVGPTPLSISSDGRRVLLARVNPSAQDLLLARWDSTFGPVTEYLAANWREYSGSLSPDGRWVAYVSDEDANTPGAPRQRVYVRSFPEPGERFTVSDSLGAYPRWSPDGRTIYHWRGSTLVAAAVRTTPTFAVTARRDLFTRPASRASSFDVHPDGKRFVMGTLETPGGAGVAQALRQTTRLVLVVNWIEELRKKAEARK